MKMRFTPQQFTARLLARTLTLQEFCSLHSDFINDKILEGLASRTISDHKKHMNYLQTYACGEYQQHDKIDKNMFRNYIHYMINDKYLKP